MQDNLADAEERIEKLITQKADYEQQLKELEERLLDQEDEAGELGEKCKKLGDEVKELKADVEDLENALAKVSVLPWPRQVSLCLCLSVCLSLPPSFFFFPFTPINTLCSYLRYSGDYESSLCDNASVSLTLSFFVCLSLSVFQSL